MVAGLYPGPVAPVLAHRQAHPRPAHHRALISSVCRHVSLQIKYGCMRHCSPAIFKIKLGPFQVPGKCCSSHAIGNRCNQYILVNPQQNMDIESRELGDVGAQPEALNLPAFRKPWHPGRHASLLKAAACVEHPVHSNARVDRIAGEDLCQEPTVSADSRWQSILLRPWPNALQWPVPLGRPCSPSHEVCGHSCRAFWLWHCHCTWGMEEGAMPSIFGIHREPCLNI